MKYRKISLLTCSLSTTMTATTTIEYFGNDVGMSRKVIRGLMYTFGACVRVSVSLSLFNLFPQSCARLFSTTNYCTMFILVVSFSCTHACGTLEAKRKYMSIFNDLTNESNSFCTLKLAKYAERTKK